ncbi:phosphoribosyltransferase domain-containing protein [Endozoicomonas sp. SM1973]|uniref:Phosphoribosyltransferase domain-containing protein n=1 Tax=Spartinivicinus marinus TaxID=2994442 RepID=A0A853I5H8_9GAMM|nr:phosphoribosyltransferase domain-containing protein [Spartinivicinus marinus]MCX4029022.1 phosphoribosyltransferase domain-containing protein [Spartinivicinus marinus]NYZ65394.1 phosphoribosyltransferase domain-containing protein [Spartinivicinus marinus]
MEEKVEIQSGALAFTINHHQNSQHYSLFDLLTFGARQNPKRGYLFISKVLGKHIPCRPALMRKTYCHLAEATQLIGDSCLVVGLAETATGLGAGVAEALVKPGHNLLYTHTTRYQLIDVPVIFKIDESHSHAPAHIVYQPAQQMKVKQVQTAVLVDDEITTGNTLLQLSEKLIDYVDDLQKIVWVSLVSWLSEQRKAEIQQLLPGVEVSFVCLVAGDFQFTPSAEFSCDLPARTQQQISQQAVLVEIRRGITFNEETNRFYKLTGTPFTLDELVKSEKYIVLGYGEFLYQPYKLAEQMESQGFDVVFQSTTRSPILEGDGIKRKEIFAVEDGYENYVYNRPEERTTIIAYETYAQYKSCGLAKQIDCIPVIQQSVEV